MAKKSNKNTKKLPQNDSTAFTKSDWYGTGKRDRVKKKKKQK